MSVFRRIFVEMGAGLGSIAVGIAGWLFSILAILVAGLISGGLFGDSSRFYENMLVVTLTITTIWQVTYALLIRIGTYRFRLSAPVGFVLGYVICLAAAVLVVLWSLAAAAGASSEGGSPAVLFILPLAGTFLPIALIVFPATFVLSPKQALGAPAGCWRSNAVTLAVSRARRALRRRLCRGLVKLAHVEPCTDRKFRDRAFLNDGRPPTIFSA